MTDPVPRKRDGIPLGRIAGVPISLSYSWFLIAAFIVIFFGPQFERVLPNLGFGAYAAALSYAILLLISVLIHELAHALSARVFGWPTQKIVLNLWGGHTQFDQFTSTPGRSLVVALAGPVANFVLSGIGWLLLPVLDRSPVMVLLASFFVLANFLVAAFNVLPGLPLDGGRIVESAVWKATGSQDRGTIAAGWAGRIIVIALVVAVIGVPVLRGTSPSLQLVVIVVLVGGFMWVGAGAGIHGARMRLRLPRISAGGLAVPAIGLASSATVAQVRAALARPAGVGAVGSGSAGGRTAVVLVASTGQPQGVVDGAALSRVTPDQAVHTPAVAVARALAPGAYVPETAVGEELIEYLAQLAGNEYAVISHEGVVTGMLYQSTVVAAVTGKSQPQ